MAKKKLVKLSFIIAVAAMAVISAGIVKSFSKNQKVFKAATSETKTQLWEYQCIDTMKTSRDRARSWARRTDLKAHIKQEMNAIVNLGANCVAIDTPYDEEFLSYLKLWVESAREHNLKVWFRGNFSEWEGWFEYAGNLSPEAHLKMTNHFIVSNPDLFRDGDIFTPAPEAENGNYFKNLNLDQYRTFLIDEHNTAKGAFEKINKQVKTNWLSMSGGQAMLSLDQKIIDALGKVVTIDHYVKNPEGLGEYIKHFNEKFGAQVVIGEWGAPIPDINGSMTKTQQSQFIRDLLWQMYKHKDAVSGINYWILYEGTTALYDKNFNPLPAVDVIKEYFNPSVIEGTITDELGNPLSDVEVKASDGIANANTNEQGVFNLVLPANTTELHMNKNGYGRFTKKYNLEQNKKYEENYIMINENPTLWQRLLRILKSATS